MSKKTPEKAAEKTLEVVKSETPPAPAKIIPVRVTDMDRMTALLAGEKVKRAQAELQALALKLNTADAELKALDAAEKAVLREVWTKYELGADDTFDSNTGMITRK
jgi:hypothetical protein